MNSLAVRYALEFAIVIPAAVFALLPVMSSLRFSSSRALVIAGVLLSGSVALASHVCAIYAPKVRSVIIPGVLVLLAVYVMCVNLPLTRKLFCFFNAAMLCEFCPMYTPFITSALEIGNFSGVSSVTSGLVSLGLAVIVGAAFFRTLTVKIPVLLHEERISSAWKFMFLFPLSVALLMHWMTPISPIVVLTGRVRPVSLVVMLIIPAVMFLFYHVSYWLVARMNESAKLQQENTLLTMENKRYNELKSYMDTTRTLRHDFRQHILVISQLAGEGKFYELQDYLAPLTKKASTAYRTFCANRAVDAIASHYDSIAGQQDTNIEWRLELPNVLPVNEADFCAMFGNLLENALHAVKELPHEKRKVKAICSMLSDRMIGVSTDNPYAGTFTDSKKGTGLASVAGTVERYGGSLNINAENNIFSVDIILYCNS